MFRLSRLAICCAGLLIAVRPVPESPSVLADEKPRAPATITNSLGMKLVLIPAGKFTMGSPESEKGHTALEPQHEVQIDPAFYLGAHEVTVGAFRAFTVATGYKTEAEQAGSQRTWKNALDVQTDDHPVSLISWNDAQAFCAWLSKVEGQAYRLPSDAQWEYACRAGTQTRFYSGDDDEAGLKQVANIGTSTTIPVGRLKPNRFGLYDMHGNVYEWCRDCLEEGSVRRVMRGGAFDWCDYRSNCRSAYRTGMEPSSRYAWVGFRVARDVTVPELATPTETGDSPGRSAK